VLFWKVRRLCGLFWKEVDEIEGSKGVFWNARRLEGEKVKE
jgi:hypothetical protein